MSLVKYCVICNSSLNPDKEIKCDFCFHPVHTTCSGLTRAEVTCLLSASRRISYQCKKCSDKKQEISELKEMILDLTKQVSELKNKTMDSLTCSTPELAEKFISEIRDRNLRASNVIMYNVPESTCQILHEKAAEDKGKVDEIVRMCSSNPVEIKSVIRLGKSSHDKSRPLKVVFKNEADAIEVLRNKKNLPASVPVRINNDLTPMQREYLNSLRNQLQERIGKGERDLTIRYIRGSPAIVKTAKN